MDSRLSFECGDSGLELKAEWVIERLMRIEELVHKEAPQVSETVKETLSEIMSMVVITDVYSDHETRLFESSADSDCDSFH